MTLRNNSCKREGCQNKFHTCRNCNKWYEWESYYCSIDCATADNANIENKDPDWTYYDSE